MKLFPLFIFTLAILTGSLNAIAQETTSDEVNRGSQYYDKNDIPLPGSPKERGSYSEYSAPQPSSPPSTFRANVNQVKPPLYLKKLDIQTESTSVWGIGGGWSMAFDDDDFMTGGGFYFQGIFWKKLGLELSYNGYSTLDKEIYDYVRDTSLFEMGAFYFPGQQVVNKGFYPYMRIGFLHKTNEYYRTRSASFAYRTETSWNGEMGVGFQWRFAPKFLWGPVLSINAELLAIAPNSSEIDDNKSTILATRIKFMIHF